MIPFLARHGSVVTARMAEAARAYARRLVGTATAGAAVPDHRAAGERTSRGVGTAPVNHVESTPAADV
jgi:hypothetical protein